MRSCGAADRRFGRRMAAARPLTSTTCWLRAEGLVRLPRRGVGAGVQGAPEDRGRLEAQESSHRQPAGARASSRRHRRAWTTPRSTSSRSGGSTRKSLEGSSSLRVGQTRDVILAALKESAQTSRTSSSETPRMNSRRSPRFGSRSSSGPHGEVVRGDHHGAGRIGAGAFITPVKFVGRVSSFIAVTVCHPRSSISMWTAAPVSGYRFEPHRDGRKTSRTRPPSSTHPRHRAENANRALLSQHHFKVRQLARGDALPATRSMVHGGLHRSGPWTIPLFAWFERALASVAAFVDPGMLTIGSDPYGRCHGGVPAVHGDGHGRGAVHRGTVADVFIAAELVVAVGVTSRARADAGGVLPGLLSGGSASTSMVIGLHVCALTAAHAQRRCWRRYCSLCWSTSTSSRSQPRRWPAPRATAWAVAMDGSVDRVRGFASVFAFGVRRGGDGVVVLPDMARGSDAGHARAVVSVRQRFIPAYWAPNF